MNGQTITHKLFTIIALSVLIMDNIKANLSPVSPPVCIRPTNPIRGISPRFVNFSKIVSALFGAVVLNIFRTFVYPGWFSIRLPAKVAYSGDVISFPAWTKRSNILTFFETSRISNWFRSVSIQCINTQKSATVRGTYFPPSRGYAVFCYKNISTAYDTFFLYSRDWITHMLIIPHFNGSGTDERTSGIQVTMPL